MKKNNDFVKSIVVLGSICLIIAVLLAAVNYVTAPIIEENAKGAANDSLKVVLPDATSITEAEIPGDAPETVTGIYKDEGGSGYAVTLSATSQYSQSPMTFTVGIGPDGKIIAVEMTNYAETKDFGDYPQSYVGADSALGGIDLFAGATYSSTAFKDAVSDAFTVLTGMGAVSEGQKSDEQLVEELKASILPGALDRAGGSKLDEMSVSGTYVTQAFSASNNTGWVFVIDDGETLVAAVSPTGGAVCLNLEGVDVTADHGDALAEAVSLADFTKSAAANLATVQKTAGEGVALTEVKTEGLFGCISSIFTDGANYYLIAAPYGYREPMKLVFVLDGTGAVTGFKPASELIQDSDYYSAYELDPEAYRAGIIGMTPDSINTDAALISGATMTGGGVAEAITDVFGAYNAVKEAAK